MRITLVDVGSAIPNLALMRYSAWHKAHGDEVTLLKMGGRYRDLPEWPPGPDERGDWERVIADWPELAPVIA